MTQELANFLFDYNEVTGVLTVSKNGEPYIRGKLFGDIADTASKSYIHRSVKYNYKNYATHRLIGLMLNGEWPDQVVHKNGDRFDNSLENLLFTDRSYVNLNKWDRPKLTPEYIATLFTYNPITGEILRNGNPCGFTCKTHGYSYYKIHKKRFTGHKLAYILMNGKYPNNGMVIDHINHNRSDNRWDNLREVTSAENNKNKSLPINNKSGVNGVSYVKKSGRWKAVINIDGKHIQLCECVNKEDAIAIRLKAEKEYGYTSGTTKSEYNTRSRQVAQATPKWLDADDKELIKWFYDTAKERTLQYGIPFEVDHIIPINGKDVCGFHMAENLQIITRSENRSKGYKLEGDR